MNHSTAERDARTGRDGVLVTLLKGGLIGVANIIPGVSGGTFALILGVFDRMVGALNAIGPETVRVLFRLLAGGFRRERRREFAAELRRVDALECEVERLAVMRAHEYVAQGHRAVALLHEVA